MTIFHVLLVKQKLLSEFAEKLLKAQSKVRSSRQNQKLLYQRKIQQMN